MSQPTNQAPAQGRGNAWLLGLACAWAVIVFIRYFFSSDHPLGRAFPFIWKVFDTSALPNVPISQRVTVIGDSFRILLAAFVISGATWACGRRLRSWLALDLPDAWVRFAFDFGLGVVLLGLFWVGTGLERLWFMPIWMTGWALFLIGSALELWSLFKDGVKWSVEGLFPREASYRFLLVIGILYFLFSVTQNLDPETFYDSMVYHLAVPQYWLSHHGLHDFPTNFFSNFPFGGEIYFLNGLVFQGTETAKVLHAVSFGVCALLAGGWARELAGAGLGLGQPRPSPRHTQGSPLDSKVSGQGGGEQAGWLTLGLVLTFPLLAINTWSTQVEGFLTLFLILFLYALVRFVRGGSELGWGLAAGFFGGLAIAVKYTAVLVGGSALLILAFQEPSLFKKEKWKFWLAAAMGCLLLAGPWVLKNLVYTGNPFFPYFMYHFPGRHLSAFGYEQLLQEQHARIGGPWWSWLVLPWVLAMGNPDSYNFCGPLVLGLLPLLFLFRLRHPTLRFLAFLTPLVLVLGLTATHILRFVVPDFILLYILLGTVLAGGDRPVWGSRTALAAGFSAILCFSYLSAISNFYYSPIGIWTGLQTRPEYLSGPGKLTSYQSMVQWLTANLPSDVRLLIVGDARGLYYDKPFLSNTVFDEQVLSQAAREEKDAEGIFRRLKKMGVDALVVNGLEGIRVSSDYHHYDLTSAQWKSLDEFIQRGTEPIFLQGYQGIYRVLPEIREPRKAESVDLLLFFSKPASRFLMNVQRRNYNEAARDLEESMKLYYFSDLWKRQKREFEINTGLGRHGTAR